MMTLHRLWIDEFRKLLAASNEALKRFGESIAGTDPDLATVRFVQAREGAYSATGQFLIAAVRSFPGILDAFDAIRKELVELGADPEEQCACGTNPGKVTCRRHPWRSAGVRFVVVPGRRLSDDKPVDIVITEIAERWVVTPIGFARDEVRLLDDPKPEPSAAPPALDIVANPEISPNVVLVTDGEGRPLVQVPPGNWSIDDIVHLNPFTTRRSADGKSIEFTCTMEIRKPFIKKVDKHEPPAQPTTDQQPPTPRLVLCSGCQGNEPLDHRCWTFVDAPDGSSSDVKCQCRDCREAKELFDQKR